MHELKMKCQASGFYAHWLLTEAQDGTFTEVELGDRADRVEPGCEDRWRAGAPHEELPEAPGREAPRRPAAGSRPRSLTRSIESARDRGAADDLDPHRVARELPDQRRARLRRDRLQGAPSPPGRGVRARRRDLLLRHRRPGVRRNRPGEVARCSRTARRSGPGKKGQAGGLPLAGRGRAGPDPARGGVRSGRGARHRARARPQVAAGALASRLPGPAADDRRGRRASCSASASAAADRRRAGA